jgi:uncharacterized protein (DUF1810 family)
MTDPFNLQRFIDAQRLVYEEAVDEIRHGRKESHWMWFVFPQMRGLGASGTSIRYGIASLEEARAYLAHPVLGERLKECTGFVVNRRRGSVADLFGFPDHLKYHSCVSLFRLADPQEPLFRTALERDFDGALDPRTVKLVEGA